MQDVLRVRLVGRADGPVYLIFGSSAVASLRADELRDARLGSEQTAQDIAIAYARARGLDASTLRAAEPISYDQWTVSGEFDSDRPLYRVALDDSDGTELYVSSITGAVVLVTTRSARALNYVGSIVHWIYPATLRHHRPIWSALLWWLSLVATCGAAAGIVIGLIRLATTHRRARRPIAACKAGTIVWALLLRRSSSAGSSAASCRWTMAGCFRTEPHAPSALVLAGTPAWHRLPADVKRNAPHGARTKSNGSHSPEKSIAATATLSMSSDWCEPDPKRT